MNVWLLVTLSDFSALSICYRLLNGRVRLEPVVAYLEDLTMIDQSAFYKLESYLSRVPALVLPFGSGFEESGRWWIKFEIDIDHSLAWHVVQELAHVLNYLSANEQLPTVFKPVSPPSYMNGGPRGYLSWIIECHDPDFQPSTIAEWLEDRLPCPVNDLSQWAIDD